LLDLPNLRPRTDDRPGRVPAVRGRAREGERGDELGRQEISDYSLRSQSRFAIQPVAATAGASVLAPW
jgi:hypothetical protein